jgi:hypothetical protein
MRLSVTLVLAMAFAALAAGDLPAQDQNSVVDYLKSTGRGSSFQERAELFNQYSPGETYTGSAAQNTNLGKAIRASDADLSLGAVVPPDPNQYGPFEVPRTGEKLAGRFDAPMDCTPLRERSSLFERVRDDAIGKRLAPCCGATNRCEHLSEHCFGNDLNGACAQHDRDLTECGRPWHDFDDSCVRRVHRELSERLEGAPLTREVFRRMGQEPSELSQPWSALGPLYEPDPGHKLNVEIPF